MSDPPDDERKAVEDDPAAIERIAIGLLAVVLFTVSVSVW